MYRQQVVDFPFELTSEVIKTPEHFNSNSDLRLNFVKSIISRDNARATLTLDLCSGEILELFAFFVITAENTKKYCRFKLQMNKNEYAYIVCDVLSNIIITGNVKLNVSFEVSILEHY